jgi:hypothetical protein
MISLPNTISGTKVRIRQSMFSGLSGRRIVQTHNGRNSLPGVISVTALKCGVRPDTDTILGVTLHGMRGNQ